MMLYLMNSLKSSNGIMCFVLVSKSTQSKPFGLESKSGGISKPTYCEPLLEIVSLETHSVAKLSPLNFLKKFSRSNAFNSFPFLKAIVWPVDRKASLLSNNLSPNT